MFVLLEHQVAGAVHWDFMIELPDHLLLATWRLDANPVGCAAVIRAERIGDHRRDYLEYEGEIGGNRGRVRRVDRGDATIISKDGCELSASLKGRFLIGRVTLTVVAGDTGDSLFSLTPA